MTSDYDLLYFLHIPKTAGTSLRASIETAFPSGQRGYWYPGSLTTHDSLADALEPPTRFFAGHLDARIIRKAEPRKVLTLTVLRDPDERAYSVYRHFQRNNGFVGSFVEFADAFPNQVENIQAKCLAGRLPRKPVAPLVLLREAMPRIFDPAWIVESINSLDVVQRRLAAAGVSAGELGRLNEAPAPAPDIPSEVLEEKRRWRVDTQLWLALQDRDAQRPTGRG